MANAAKLVYLTLVYVWVEAFAFSYCGDGQALPRVASFLHWNKERGFKPLFTELERRHLPYVRLDASAHEFDRLFSYEVRSVDVPAAYCR